MKITKNELLKLYIDKQLSIYEIAKITKIKSVTLYWYIKKYNIPIRNNSLAGKISWNKGISKVTPNMRKVNLKNIKKARKCITVKSRKKQSKTMMEKYDNGLMPHNWREGAQSELNRRVRRPRWKKISYIIKNRDNFTCQYCGRKNIILQVHHKDNNGYNNNQNNLITLCCSCHIKIHWKLRHTIKI